jgi:hypothetical protein
VRAGAADQTRHEVGEGLPAGRAGMTCHLEH